MASECFLSHCLLFLHLTPFTFTHWAGCLCYSSWGQSHLVKPGAFSPLRILSRQGMLSVTYRQLMGLMEQRNTSLNWISSADDTALKSQVNLNRVWCSTETSLYLFTLRSVPEWEVTKISQKPVPRKGIAMIFTIFFLCNKNAWIYIFQKKSNLKAMSLKEINVPTSLWWRWW